MLDRPSAGLITLPDATYDLILVLTDADSIRAEFTQLLNREVFTRIMQSDGLGTQDDTFSQAAGS